MSKKLGITTIIISLLAVCLSAGAIFITVQSSQGSDVQYVLYLGTNDKDTNQPVCTPEEAVSRAESILVNHVEGFTIQDANGGWTDNGTLYREYTVVIYLSDTTIDKVHEVADALISEFNQSSVLIHTNQTRTEFYEGGE